MTSRTALNFHAALLAACAGCVAAPALAQDEDREEDGTIVVTGSRIARGTFDSPAPVTTLGADDLQRRGVTNIAEAITELPSFRDTTSPQTQGFGSFNVGARIVNLRGLGVTRNLVLVNGRRFAPPRAKGRSTSTSCRRS